jgi:hypothetical protein
MPSGTKRKSKRNHDAAELAPLFGQISGYCLAASAAGVTVLACSSPVDAAPVCTTTTISFRDTMSYPLNPASQKVAPFNVVQTYNNVSSLSHYVGLRGFFTPNIPSANTVLDANGFPADLPAGAVIGPDANFGKGNSYGEFFQFQYFQGVTGPFASGQPGYAGFEFSQAGQTHYGWIRMRVVQKQRYYPFLLVSEYGYESTPNTAIAAGSCATSASSIEPGPEPQPQAARSAEKNKSGAAPSLGLLALGSEGLPLWRRETLPNTLPTSKSYAGDLP